MNWFEDPNNLNTVAQWFGGAGITDLPCQTVGRREMRFVEEKPSYYAHTLTAPTNNHCKAEQMTIDFFRFRFCLS